METQVTNSEAETSALAKTLLSRLENNLILLKGELGAGKTAFIRGLGEALGIKRILSPTYTIIRSYKLETPVKTKGLEITNFHHVDLYRITDLRELEQLGLFELIKDQHNLLAIEWPQLLENSFNTHYQRKVVTFDVQGETKRLIRIS